MHSRIKLVDEPWFKDRPDGVQLHVGTWRSQKTWHSDDGGRTWWCGFGFSHTAKVTRKELSLMAQDILQTIG